MNRGNEKILLKALSRCAALRLFIEPAQILLVDEAQYRIDDENSMLKWVMLHLDFNPTLSLVDTAG